VCVVYPILNHPEKYFFNAECGQLLHTQQQNFILSLFSLKCIV